MYTHNLLPLSDPQASKSLLNPLVTRQLPISTIFHSDSNIRLIDLGQLQDIPLLRLTQIATYLDNSLSIEYLGKPYINTNNTPTTIDFPEVRGFYGDEGIYGFNLPPILIDIPTSSTYPLTLYLCLNKELKNLQSDYFTHLPTTLRPPTIYQGLSIKYSLEVIPGLINIPVMKVHSYNGKLELFLIPYGTDRNTAKGINSDTYTPDLATSYIAKGLTVSINDKVLQVSSGVIYNQSIRILIDNSIRIDLSNPLYNNKDYNLNINSTHVWLSSPNQIGSDQEILQGNDDSLSTQTLTIGKIKVRTNALHYYEYLPRVNCNWYEDLLIRLEATIGTISNLKELNTNTPNNNLHITNFLLMEDVTHPEASVSYVSNRFPTTYASSNLIPFNTLITTNASREFVKTQTLIGTSQPIVLLTTLPSKDTASVLVSRNDVYPEIVITTPISPLNQSLIKSVQLTSRFRGFKPFSTISSVKVNNTLVSNSSISLGVTGSRDQTLFNIGPLTKGFNEHTFLHEDRYTQIPLLDSNPVYIKNTPEYVYGQTFTITQSTSIYTIGLYLLNTDYIKQLGLYQASLFSTYVYKVSGDLLETNKPYYIGDSVIGSINTEGPIYLESQPLLSLVLSPGKYVFLVVPHVHPLYLHTAIDSYSGGTLCTIGQKLQTLREDISRDLAFTIKGCYVTPLINPKSITLTTNQSLVSPYNSTLTINDPFHQLNELPTPSLNNGVLLVPLLIRDNTYLSLEALSLLNTIYANEGIWVSKPLLINRLNIRELEVSIRSYLPGISQVKVSIGIDSSSVFIPLTNIITNTQSNNDSLIVYSITNSLTVNRFLTVKLQVIKDIREKEIPYVKEVLIKPIT